MDPLSVTGSSIRRNEPGDKIHEFPDKKREEERLKKACAGFESIFIYHLLQSMRKTVPKGGYLSENSTSKETYMMMFDQKVAEELAKKGGGIGLQKMLFNQLHNNDNRD